MDYNRLYLNVNNGDRNQAYNERHQLYNDRVYPTTPSTFPQQIYEGQQMSGYGRQQQLQQQGSATNNYNNSSNYGGGAAGGGYFTNSHYQTQYQQPQGQRFQQQQQQQQQPSSQAPLTPQYGQGYATSQASYQVNPMAYSHADGANGLVHQFAHQNLGPTPRQTTGYGRDVPPAEGVRTPRSLATPQSASHRPAPGTGESLKPEILPERKGDMLPKCILQRVTVCRQYLNSFFKQAVSVARERNER